MDQASCARLGGVVAGIYASGEGRPSYPLGDEHYGVGAKVSSWPRGERGLLEDGRNVPGWRAGFPNTRSGRARKLSSEPIKRSFEGLF